MTDPTKETPSAEAAEVTPPAPKIVETNTPDADTTPEAAASAPEEDPGPSLVTIGREALVAYSNALLAAPGDLLRNVVSQMEAKHGDGNGEIKKTEAVDRVVGTLVSVHPILERFVPEIRDLVDDGVETAVDWLNSLIKKK